MYSLSNSKQITDNGFIRSDSQNRQHLLFLLVHISLCYVRQQCLIHTLSNSFREAIINQEMMKYAFI